MTYIDKNAFEYAVKKIKDGWVFEKFSQEFLSAIIGYTFLPVGGSKDKGLDGINHLFHRKGKENQYFQMSTEEGVKGKIFDTITKLKKNKKSIDLLNYVTNRKVNNIDVLTDEIFDEKGIRSRIYDIKWFVSNSNKSEASIKAYNIFVDSYFHEFSKPGSTWLVNDFDVDSRVYVFLRHQLDELDHGEEVADAIADTLILTGLEGTDPNKNILRSKKQIKDEFYKKTSVNINTLDTVIDRRLVKLSKKPRKINWHKKTNEYCLKYEARMELIQRNLSDESLLEVFFNETEAILKEYLDVQNVQIKNVLALIQEAIKSIYYEQGLDFSTFVLEGHGADVMERNLVDTVGKIVDDSRIITKNKQKVKTALLMTIREIVYNGTTDQKEYLRRLSKTYATMFLLKIDPKISSFFNTLASKLTVFVGTSIIIPALSEYYLTADNKRHWNLLKAAHSAGIELVYNNDILNELADHFEMLIRKYKDKIYENEIDYISDEYNISLIEEVMLRAYLYSKQRKQVTGFNAFINNYIDPTLKSVKEDIVEFLKSEFGLEYKPNYKLGVEIPNDKYVTLWNELALKKKTDRNAKSDARLILTVYGLREKHNEISTTTIFGYRTWWLSKDTTTFEVVNKKFPKEYNVSCYLRPDFLYNFIQLSPSKKNVSQAYENVFPTMLGVNLSFHIPKEISLHMQKVITDHEHLNQPRRKATIRSLIEKLKCDPSTHSVDYIKKFLN